MEAFGPGDWRHRCPWGVAVMALAMVSVAGGGPPLGSNGGLAVGSAPLARLSPLPEPMADTLGLLAGASARALGAAGYGKPDYGTTDCGMTGNGSTNNGTTHYGAASNGKPGHATAAPLPEPVSLNGVEL